MQVAASIVLIHSTARVVGDIYEMVAAAINMLAAVIMVFGVLLAVLNGARALMFTPLNKFHQLQKSRCGIGLAIIFALDLMIVSDVLLTLIERSGHELSELILLVATRTVMAFFLSKEIAEIENAMHNSAFKM